MFVGFGVVVVVGGKGGFAAGVGGYVDFCGDDSFERVFVEGVCCISLGQFYPFRGSTGAPRNVSVLRICFNKEMMGWRSLTEEALELMPVLPDFAKSH